uniref:DUF5681 domain-containing protein n=1 Tax=Altererythrobacter segetis TaxID=1104773 RepID=UPI00140E5C9E|nr:DUF5681 domain-containing protein [Altererythrobacter segetis]
MPIVPITPDPSSNHNPPPPRVRVRTRSAPAAEPVDQQADEPARLDQRDYEVGYKKPPKHTRFRPGQSGNSKGRPRKAKGLNTLVRETLGGKIAVRTGEGTKRISRIEAVLQKTLEQAMKGNPRAQLELIKLWKNAVPETNELEGAANAPEEDLTAADLAILQALREELTGTGDGQ